MDSPPTLDAFHARLDQLLALVWPYLDELEARAERDDAIMKLWATEPVLSDEQKRQREEFQTWVASDGSAFDDPEVAAESCVAFCWWREDSYLSIQEAIRRCREASGYGEPSVIPRSALQYLDQSLRDCMDALRRRLREPWPRPRIADALSDVRINSFLLSERRLIEMIERNEERNRLTRNESDEQMNVLCDKLSMEFNARITSKRSAPPVDRQGSNWPTTIASPSPTDMIVKASDRDRQLIRFYDQLKTTMKSVTDEAAATSWNKKYPNEVVSADCFKSARWRVTHDGPVQLVTVTEVVGKLKQKNVETTEKTLNNTYTRAWGKSVGKRGRAPTYDWSTVRPIVEGQFSVSFGE